MKLKSLAIICCLIVVALGADAKYQLLFFRDALRETVDNWVGEDGRVHKINRLVEESEETLAKMSRKHGATKAELEQAFKVHDEKLAQTDSTRAVLKKLRQRLESTAEPTVVVGRRKFTRQELQDDAEQLLDRLQRQKKSVADQKRVITALQNSIAQIGTTVGKQKARLAELRAKFAEYQAQSGGANARSKLDEIEKELAHFRADTTANDETSLASVTELQRERRLPLSKRIQAAVQDN